jgi:hypothetical protein
MFIKRLKANLASKGKPWWGRVGCPSSIRLRVNRATQANADALTARRYGELIDVSLEAVDLGGSVAVLFCVECLG